MDLYVLLIIGHLVGTVLGVGGATMIEVLLNNSLKDGKVSPDEAEGLKKTYTVVRWGILITLFSGFGFLLLYKISGQTFRLYDPLLWSKLVLLIVILVNALLLQTKKINLYWGSAISFVTWWYVMLLGIFSTHRVLMSFWTVVIVYVISLVVIAWILHLIRERIKRKYHA